MRSAFIVLALALAPSSYGFSPSITLRQQQKHSRRTPSISTTSGSSGGTIVTRLHSVPTSIDTLLSGLASVARLPRGVTASGGISLAGPAASSLPTLEKLYDVENDRDCRRARERITELDLVVGRVVPVTPGSRAVLASKTPIVAPTLVANVDGKELTLRGADDVLAFLDDKFAKEIEAGDEGDAWNRAWDLLSDLVSYLPGALRAGRGSDVCGAASPSLGPPRPMEPLVLYSYEGNQFCRLVREVLAELDLVYELRSAGKKSPRREELKEITGGSSQCPFLMDPNTGVNMAESGDIVEYLYSNYALWTPPSELLRSASDVATPLLAPLYKYIAPLQAGSNREDELEYAADMAKAKAEIRDEILTRPVVIYTYEYSPVCSEAVALLKSTGTTFEEVSLGREWIPGLIGAPAKRAALLEMTGESSLPHVFVGGASVGGLFSGSPGLVPALEGGQFTSMVEEAERST